MLKSSVLKQSPKGGGGGWGVGGVGGVIHAIDRRQIISIPGQARGKQQRDGTCKRLGVLGQRLAS